MMSNPYHFYKLLTVLSQIDHQAHLQQTLNKRAVYYTLIHSIKTTGELDDLICDCCFLLGCSRADLGITASAKGLYACSLTREQDVDFMQIPAKFAEDLGTNFDRITTVIVVEKDTVFQRVICLPLVAQNDQVLCVTGKGYPDFATRKFLLLLQRQNKRLYYIGDADPFGADIFFTYCFGSLKFAISESQAFCERLEIQWIGPFMQDFTQEITRLKMTQRDELKAFSLLSKTFLQD